MSCTQPTMISISPSINNRKIFYISINDSLEELKAAPLKNWVVFVIADDLQKPILEDFADICIDKDVLYMCATGNACSEIDDLFDMNMVMRKMEGRPLPIWYKSEENTLMTTWHDDFEEGFWFCTTLANYEDHFIDTVLVTNLTEVDYLHRIQELSKSISKGWLPPD